MIALNFDYLAANTAQSGELALAYDQVVRRLLSEPHWTGGSIKERRIPWNDAKSLRDVETFHLPGLYIWGAEKRPVYIGKTETSFRERFGRYIWQKQSQCNLATEFETTLLDLGITGFPSNIRQSAVRRAGAVRFAMEGISKVWFALFPAGDTKKIRPVEKALIPVANAWNIQAGMKPLLNIESNRRLISRMQPPKPIVA